MPTQNNIVISVMDRESWEARTDNIVIVDILNKSLIWVPRDLWSFKYEMRINAVFRKFSHEGFIEALREFEFNVISSICFLPSSIANAIHDFEIEVPVKERLVFRYPVQRNIPIEEAERIITFNAPKEILKGDRFHQWVGARYEVRPSRGDLRRIERQQILISEMLKINFDFTKFLGTESIFGNIERLRDIDNTWELKTLNNGNFKGNTIKNQEILLYESVLN